MSGYSATVSEAAAQQDFIKSSFTTLRRLWLFISLGTLTLFAGMAVGIQFLPKTYQGIASVEVLSKTPIVASPDIVTGDQVFTDETAGTELGIFSSYDLRTAVIQKLGLLNNAEFNPHLRPSLLRQISDYIGESALAKFVPEGMLPAMQQPSEDRILFDTVQAFAKKVTVEPVSHSRILQVTATSRDPALAASVANATVNEYIDTHRQQKEDAYKQAYEFTKNRLPALRADMIAKSKLVLQFRQKHDLVSGQYAPILREKLTEASKHLIDGQNRLGQLRAQLAQSKSGDIMNNATVLSSPTIARLREQQAQIGAEGAGREAQAATYVLRAQFMEAAIHVEAMRIIKSLPDQVAVQEATVLAQQQEVDRLQGSVSKMDNLESQLEPLETDARIATKQYSDFLSSDSVSRPDVAFTAVNVRILSSSPVPYQPHFPNDKLMLPAALVLSFLSTCGLALYYGRRVGFASSAHFQNVFQIEPIGIIPYRTKVTEQAYWEAVMFLSMKLSPPYERAKQTILMTSAQPNEGKTTIALGLAEVFARRDVSVALVDADMRRIRAPRPGQAPMIGLRDVLSKMVTLDQAMTAENGITVIHAGSSGLAHPTSLIASDVMPDLLARLRETHDIVIIDGPPAPIGGDSWALSKLVDRVLCVVKQSTTGEQQVDDAFKAISRPSTEIDVVLNMIRIQGDPSFAHLQYYKSSF